MGVRGCERFHPRTAVRGFHCAKGAISLKPRICFLVRSVPLRYRTRASAGLFQLNPSWRTGEIHLRWMKSLRDEIRLRRVKRTDLISSSAKCSISSEGFARRFHRGAPQGPRNELAEFWGKGQCLDFTYHTILRLNMGCSAPAEMCFSQVRYRHLHQKVVGSAYEQHPQPRRRSRIERNHIPINARGGEINSPPHSFRLSP